MSAERQKQTDRSLKYLQDRCLLSAQLAYWVIAASLWEAESLQESFQINSVENINYSSGDSVLLVSSGCVWFLNKTYAITHSSKDCMTLSQQKNPGKSTSSIFHSVSQQLFMQRPLWCARGLSSIVRYQREMRQHSVSNELLTAAASSLSATGSIQPSITRSDAVVHIYWGNTQTVSGSMW